MFSWTTCIFSWK